MIARFQIKSGHAILCWNRSVSWANVTQFLYKCTTGSCAPGDLGPAQRNEYSFIPGPYFLNRTVRIRMYLGVGRVITLHGGSNPTPAINGTRIGQQEPRRPNTGNCERRITRLFSITGCLMRVATDKHAMRLRDVVLTCRIVRLAYGRPR